MGGKVVGAIQTRWQTPAMAVGHATFEEKKRSKRARFARWEDGQEGGVVLPVST